MNKKFSAQEYFKKQESIDRALDHKRTMDKIAKLRRELEQKGIIRKK